ncbi:unnamed protein product [Phytophthora lilii]|uniref:Unnamed protein product n=1 Tax=Phytophthora lilii TaxID=2077276 RepID=A0A9W6U4H4_9STRA|nr:unnamed protein product [Phytophthora lilii]
MSSPYTILVAIDADIKTDPLLCVWWHLFSCCSISAVAPNIMMVQKTIVPAAKAAGIQLFVPAEYGVRVTEGPNVAKKEVQELLAHITSRTDVGRFVAHVLSTAAKSALEGARLPFETERLSPLQIRDLVEKKLGKKIEVRHVDYEENKKNFDTDVVAFITTMFEEGHGLVDTEKEVKETAAKFFPDWNPTPYEAFIA